MLFNIWCVVWLCLGCQAQSARYRLDFTLSQSNFVDTIAIEWNHNQVYVPVQIGGHTYRFLFDTGAAQAVVYEDTPVSGCLNAGQIRSLDAAGHEGRVPLVVLPPITIGQTVFTGLQATRQQRPVKGSGVDGIIGFDLVNRGLSAKVDVHRRHLILTDRKDFFRYEEGLSLAYKLQYHVPHVKVSPIGKYTEWTLIDTGSRQLYAMNRRSFDDCTVREGTAAMATQVEGRSMGRYSIGHQGVEQRGEVVFLHLGDLRLGRYSLRHVHALTTQGDSHLGGPLLGYGAVVFSPRKHRLLFQPYADSRQVMVDNRQVDIAFVSDRGLPAVGLVWERGEPYSCGFREGDVIVRIDDTPIGSFSQFVAFPYLKGREYRFTVRTRDGLLSERRWIRLAP